MPLLDNITVFNPSAVTVRATACPNA